MGFFSYTPLAEGKGVNKNDPQLRSPFYFFYIVGTKFWQLCTLNLLFLVCCIPVVTIGPAIAAMTYILRCFIREEHVFILHDFFRVFKENFLQSLGVFLLNVLCAASLYISYVNYSVVPQFQKLFLPVVLINIIMLIMDFYMFPMLVTYKLSFGAIVKNGFIFALIKLPQNILAVLFFLGVIVAAFGFYPFIGMILSVFILFSFLWLFAVYYNRNYIEKNMSEKDNNK